MERFNDAVRTVCDLLWNFPMLVLLAGTHLYFTIRLGFIQRKLPEDCAEACPLPDQEAVTL